METMKGSQSNLNSKETQMLLKFRTGLLKGASKLFKVIFFFLSRCRFSYSFPSKLCECMVKHETK